MKELNKISRICSYLEKMYRQMNQDFFDGGLETAVITVCPTPKRYGHVTCDKVWKSQDNQLYELNLDAGTINRPIEYVASTLLHEMVHIFNMQNGIQDCSRNGTYHNQKFKVAAEKVGLLVKKDEISNTGFSITSPGNQLTNYFAEQGWVNILLNRERDAKIKTKSSTRKYKCPQCGNSVRATKEVSIMCIPCNEKMVLSE